MAAGRSADRPGAAGISLLRLLRVVTALPVRQADRVNRREVDDVEPERGQGGQHLRDAAEPTPGAREDLVPCTERGSRTLDVDAEARTLCRAVPGLPGELCGNRPPFIDGGVTEQREPFRELAAEIGLSGGDFPVELEEPGRVRVCPRLYPELPGAERIGDEPSGEAVVSLGLERHFLPAACSRTSEAQDSTERAVAVPEDRCRRRDRVAETRLDRIPATVDAWVDVLNLDSWRCHHEQGRQF